MMPKRNLVVFVPSYPVLSETFIQREIETLSKSPNLDLKVLTLRKNAGALDPDLESKIFVLHINPLTVILGGCFFLVNRSTVVLALISLLIRNKERNLFSGVYLLAKSFGYAYKLKNLAIDHVHAHFMSESSTLALLICELLKIPFSVSGHARDTFSTTGTLELKPELIAEKVARSKFVVFCNKKAYDYCISKIRSEYATKVHLVYHGIDTTLETTLGENITTDICFVGRLVEKKGLEYLLEAVKELRDQGLNYKLAIIGFGPNYEKLHKLSITYKLENTVTFVNEGKGLSNDQTLSRIKACKVLVVPSIDLDSGDTDGIPNTILEAGLFAKPVIATRAGSITEILEDAKNSLLVDQKNPHKLSTALARLLSDNELSARLGTNLHSTVLSKFDLKENTNALERLII